MHCPHLKDCELHFTFWKGQHLHFICDCDRFMFDRIIVGGGLNSCVK